jgi:hypothetical protein
VPDYKGQEGATPAANYLRDLKLIIGRNYAELPECVLENVKKQNYTFVTGVFILFLQFLIADILDEYGNVAFQLTSPDGQLSKVFMAVGMFLSH